MTQKQWFFDGGDFFFTKWKVQYPWERDELLSVIIPINHRKLVLENAENEEPPKKRNLYQS